MRGSGEHICNFKKKPYAHTHTKRERGRRRDGSGGGGRRWRLGFEALKVVRPRPPRPLYLFFFRLEQKKNYCTMALARAPSAAARPRLQSSRAARHVRPTADARRSPVSTAAAAPRAGGDSRENRRDTAAAASAFATDLTVSCPWPRPPAYQEPAHARRSLGSRVSLVVAKVRRRGENARSL